MLKKLFYPILLVLMFPMLSPATVGDGHWLVQIPPKSRQKQNPFKGNAEAIAAGEKLFRANCSKCHGMEAEGRDPRLNLHTARIKKATPGELEWLLTNGSMRAGMPSWSRLPEGERWQIVSYLKNLR